MFEYNELKGDKYKAIGSQINWRISHIHRPSVQSSNPKSSQNQESVQISLHSINREKTTPIRNLPSSRYPSKTSMSNFYYPNAQSTSPNPDSQWFSTKFSLIEPSPDKHSQDPKPPHRRYQEYLAGAETSNQEDVASEKEQITRLFFEEKKLTSLGKRTEGKFILQRKKEKEKLDLNHLYRTEINQRPYNEDRFVYLPKIPFRPKIPPFPSKFTSECLEKEDQSLRKESQSLNKEKEEKPLKKQDESRMKEDGARMKEDRPPINVRIRSYLTNQPFHLRGGQEYFSLYCVFDGHGGSGCSQFLKDNILRVLMLNKSFETDPESSLKSSISSLETTFLKLALEKESVEKSGSCALVCLIIKTSLYVANVGDSRAVLISSSGIKQLTRDHKPENKEEKLRIIRNGGKIYKVEGNLNVSRTIGDIQVKLKKFGGLPGVVIAEPEVFLYEKEDVRSFDLLLLASDGLFEGLTNQQILQLYQFALLKHPTLSHDPETLQGFLQELVTVAQSKTSDNITILLVPLPPFE